MICLVVLIHVSNIDDYAKCQLKVFSDIHCNVRERLQETSEAMCLQQHKRAAPVSLKVGDFVMLRVPDRNSKLSTKFVGPRQIVRPVGTVPIYCSRGHAGQTVDVNGSSN